MTQAEFESLQRGEKIRVVGTTDVCHVVRKTSYGFQIKNARGTLGKAVRANMWERLPAPPLPSYPAGTRFLVKSSNFSWHEPKPAQDFKSAVEIARAGGWDSRIETLDGKLVATWSVIGGTYWYDRAAAL